MTPTVRVIGLGIAGMVLLAIALGVWRGMASPQPARDGVVTGLITAEVIFAAALGLAVQAYALVSLENHHPQTVQQFDQMVRERP